MRLSAQDMQSREMSTRWRPLSHPVSVPISRAGVGLLILPIALFLLLFSPGCGKKSGQGAQRQGAASEVADAHDFWSAWRDTVRPGDTLWDILDRNQVYIADINRFMLQTESNGIFSWRRLRPGQVLEGNHDELGALRSVLYVQNAENVFMLESEGDSVAVKAVPVEKEVQLRRLKTVVNLTVDGALRNVGGNSYLLHQLSEILSWDVDFYTDPRSGDTLDVLVEEIYIDGTFYRFGDVLRVVYSGEQVTTEGVRFQSSARNNPEYFDPEGRNLRKSFLKSPLNYSRISSRFSKRRFHPILKTYRPHLGVDYAAPRGTPVVAVSDGEILEARWNGGFGYFVKVRHNPSITTTYGHLRGFAKGIRRGSRVRQGEVIGYVGSTGLSTGPHLDFRVIRDGHYVDPLRVKNPPANPLPKEDVPEFQEHRKKLMAIMGALQPGNRRPMPELAVLAQDLQGPEAPPSSP
jgi:murein DD-endopeptidase MepM/ murein hydrolase activator NlpD